LEAARQVKQEGLPNDLFTRIAADPAFAAANLAETLDPRRFVGRAPEQVDEFLAEVVEPLIGKSGDGGLAADELKV
jgi:adenylosuccinate lyase